MTPNTTAALNTQAANIAKVELLLRDAAFVLRMTHRVKAEILGSRPQPKQAPAIASSPECSPATLLV